MARLWDVFMIGASKLIRVKFKRSIGKIRERFHKLYIYDRTITLALMLMSNRSQLNKS